MSFVTEYVLGFAFTGNGDVALIRKNRPEWQAGKFNGIGGHREGNEHAVEAMSREFLEETGVHIAPRLWRRAGIMHCDHRWRVHVFTCKSKEVLFVDTKIDEEVKLISVEIIPNIRNLLIENIPALIEMCLMVPDYTDMIPLFNLDYTREQRIKTQNAK